MKLWTSLVLLTFATLLVTASKQPGHGRSCGRCNDGFFTSEIIITSNETYPPSIRENRFDFNLAFFREVMDFNDREIQTAEAEALDFLQQDMDLIFVTLHPMPTINVPLKMSPSSHL